MLTPRWLSRLTNEVRSFRASSRPPTPAAVRGRPVAVLQPGRSSITGRVLAAVMTATACSRVSDFDGRPSWPLGGIGQGRDVAADQVVGFGVADGALQREMSHGHRRAGIAGGHLR
jgi:hypothetical protein